MATFLVDISGKNESVVWVNRLKNDTYEKFCITGEPDFHFDINDVDPYSDSKWSGEKLKLWSADIQKQFAECGREILKKILEQTRKNKFESWMHPMLEMKQNRGICCIKRFSENDRYSLKKQRHYHLYWRLTASSNKCLKRMSHLQLPQASRRLSTALYGLKNDEPANQR
jgi:hypothetical protein